MWQSYFASQRTAAWCMLYERQTGEIHTNEKTVVLRLLVSIFLIHGTLVRDVPRLNKGRSIQVDSLASLACTMQYAMAIMRWCTRSLYAGNVIVWGKRR